MLKNWFKPKWQHSNPNVRVKAIARLNPHYHDHRSILLSLGQSDESADVRRTAIRRMSDWRTLVGLLSHTDQIVLSMVRIRLFELLESNRFASPRRRAEMAKETGDLTLIRRIIETSEDLEIKTHLIELLENQSFLVELSGSLPTSHLRLLAAQRIGDPIALEDALELAKGRDKGVYQLIKKRLRQMRDEQVAAVNLKEQVDDACARAEHLAHRAIDSLYGAQLDYLDSTWASIAHHATEEQTVRFNEARNLCNELLHDQKVEPAPLADRTSTMVNPYQGVITQLKKSSAVDFVVSMDNEIRQLCSRVWEPSARDELRAFLQNREVEWSYIENSASVEEQYLQLHARVVECIDASDLAINAEPEVVALLERSTDGFLIDDVQSLRDRIAIVLDNVCWPRDFPKPYYLAALKERKDELDNRLDTLAQGLKESMTWLSGSLEQLEEYINDGKTEDATILLRACQKRMFVVPISQGKALRQLLSRCQQRLVDLKDWKEYVTLPKRCELVERMRELVIEDPKFPEDHAKQIEALRVEWRDLGRFAGTAAKDIASDFDRVAEQAYVPCRTYFAQKDELRKQNSEKRANLCDQLEQYMSVSDWGEGFDWNAAINIFYTAKKEWKGNSPYSRENGKVLQDRFNLIINELKKKIDAYWNENKSIKMDLIAQARQLLTWDDVRAATEQAKALQHRWKELGSARKKDERRLWRDFKQLNDQVFGRVREARDNAQKQQESDNQAAIALVESIEALVNVVPENWIDARKHITELRESFCGFECVSKSVASECMSRIESALKQFTLAEQEDRRQQKVSAVHRFWHDLAEVESLESQALKDGHPIEDSLHALRGNLIATENERYTLLVGRVDQLLGSDDSAKTPLDISSIHQQEELEQQKRELCIRMELLCGLDSPIEDKISRMALQVGLLSKEWKGRPDELTELDQIEHLQAEWAALPLMLDRQLDATLRARFQQAAEALC